MELMWWLLGVALFIVILMVSVAVHEGGHLVAARAVGLTVKKFFVGFGPTLFSRTWRGTEYGFKGIPLGGFVQIQDDATEDEAEKMLLSNVTPWKRIIVFMAGPMVNIVIGVAILYGTLLVYPINQINAQVETVNAVSTDESVASGAASAGILEGDEFIEVNGVVMEEGQHVADVLKETTGPQGTAHVIVERNGEQVPLEIPLKDHMMGVTVGFDEVYLGPVEAAEQLGVYTVNAANAVWAIPSKIPGIIENLAPGQEPDPEAPGSVISAGNAYGDTMATPLLETEDKVRQFIVYTGAINVGLGFINLLIPFLPLDGGRILIAFIDIIRGAWSKMFSKKYTPLPTKTIGVMTAITGVAVMGFMLLVMVSDVVHIFRGNI